jgi:HlyD family secretion protein
VNVILDFVEWPGGRVTLGDGYRVEVRAVIWEAADVLKVPTSALFREGDEWAVYTVQNGRARRVYVMLGHQTGQEAEVTGGLSQGSLVILHPGQTLTDGARVRERGVTGT